MGCEKKTNCSARFNNTGVKTPWIHEHKKYGTISSDVGVLFCSVLIHLTVSGHRGAETENPAYHVHQKISPILLSSVLSVIVEVNVVILWLQTKVFSSAFCPQRHGVSKIRSFPIIISSKITGSKNSGWCCGIKCVGFYEQRCRKQSLVWLNDLSYCINSVVRVFTMLTLKQCISLKTKCWIK